MQPKAPGLILREFLLATHVNLYDGVVELASKIPCSPILIEAIVMFDHVITETMATKLGKIYSVTAKEWLAYESNYRCRLNSLESLNDQLG